MALDDYLDSQVAVAVAATAAVFSPRVRGVLRQGAVYGVAGVLTAGDALGGFVRSVGRGATRATATAAAEGAVGAPRATAQDGADAALTTEPDALDTTSGTTSDGDNTPPRVRKTPRAAGHE